MVPAKVSEGGLDDECRSSGRGTADGSARWFRQMVPANVCARGPLYLIVSNKVCECGAKRVRPRCSRVGD